MLRLFHHDGLLYTQLSRRVDILVNLGGDKVEGDKNHDDKQDEGPSKRSITVDFLKRGGGQSPLAVINHDMPWVLYRRGLELQHMGEGIVGQAGEELDRHHHSREPRILAVSVGTFRVIFPVHFEHF